MKPNDCINALRTDDPVYLTISTRNAIATAIERLVQELTEQTRLVQELKDKMDDPHLWGR